MKNVDDKNPAMSNNGVTPLHLAARNGQIEICQLILKNVHDKNPECNEGQTPFQLALENDKVAVIEYFQYAFLNIC